MAGKRRMRYTLIILWMVVSLLISPGLGQAESYTLSLGKPVVKVKPHLINGMNFGNWMIVYDLLSEYQALNIPLLRFPAGNYGDDYLLSQASLRLFKMVSDSLGTIPMVQHNLVQGDVAEAVKWVEYAKTENLGIRHWFIGNEPDLYGPNRGKTQWTPEYYADRFREYALAIKAVDPEAIIIGPAVTGTPNEEWLKTFLFIAGDLVDILAWQWYPTDGSMETWEALATAAQVGEHISMFRSWTKDPVINPLGHQREIPLFISEFGLSWRTNHARLLTDMTAALWLAEVYGEMVHAELDYSAYFALQGTGGHGLFDSALWPRPTYFVLWMLAQMGDTWNEVVGTGSRDDMVVYGSKTANEHLFYIINKQNTAITVAFPQATGSITSFWVDDQDQEAINQQMWEDQVTVAAYSVTLVRF